VLIKATGPIRTSGYVILFLLSLLAGMYLYQHYKVKAVVSNANEIKAVSQVELLRHRASEAERKLEIAEDSNDNLKAIIKLKGGMDEVVREATQLQKVEVKKIVSHIDTIKKNLPMASKTTVSAAEADTESLKRISAIWDAYCYPNHLNGNCTE
jgi:t-SNARE complex subunit (syntaxin)